MAGPRRIFRSLAEFTPRQDLSTRSSTALGREQFGPGLTAERLGPNGGSLEILRSSRSGQALCKSKGWEWQCGIC